MKMNDFSIKINDGGCVEMSQDLGSGRFEEIVLQPEQLPIVAKWLMEAHNEIMIENEKGED